MAEPTPLFVGLDVHKDSIAVAHADGTSTAPPVFVGEIGPRQADLEKRLRRLQSKTPGGREGRADSGLIAITRESRVGVVVRPRKARNPRWR